MPPGYGTKHLKPLEMKIPSKWQRKKINHLVTLNHFITYQSLSFLLTIFAQFFENQRGCSTVVETGCKLAHKLIILILNVNLYTLKLKYFSTKNLGQLFRG